MKPNQLDYTAKSNAKTFMREPSIEGGSMTISPGIEQERLPSIKVTFDLEKAKYPLRGSVKEYKEPTAPMDWDTDG